MRFLIYGFGPYRQFQDNVTEKILRELPRRGGRKKIVFPVRFHKGQFLNAIKQHRPDVILGLGQCTYGQRLRIEAQAANRRRNSPDEKAKTDCRRWTATTQDPSQIGSRTARETFQQSRGVRL